MTTIFVPDYDWNSHWSSPEEVASDEHSQEGDEFTMVRLTVGAKTTYRIVNGKPEVVSLSFPNAVPI